MFIKRTKYKEMKEKLEYLERYYSAWTYTEDIICAWCGAQGCGGFKEDCARHFFKENGVLVKNIK